MKEKMNYNLIENYLMDFVIQYFFPHYTNNEIKLYLRDVSRYILGLFILDEDLLIGCREDGISKWNISPISFKEFIHVNQIESFTKSSHYLISLFLRSDGENYVLNVFDLNDSTNYKFIIKGHRAETLI